jgi:hypothetical protein
MNIYERSVDLIIPIQRIGPSNRPTITTVAIVFLILSIVLLVLRLYTRAILVGKLGLDDAFLSISVVCSIFPLINSLY